MLIETITFTSGMSTLVGQLLLPATPGYVANVLFVHGWAGDSVGNVDRAAHLVALGFRCMTFDLRGHGGSEGAREALSPNDHLADVEAACEVLSRDESSPLYVVGTSYGAYLATLLVASRRVEGLVLRSPTLFRDQDRGLPAIETRASEATRRYRLRRHAAMSNAVFRAAILYRGAVALVLSEDDELIPEMVMENYAASFCSTRVSRHVIHGADHRLSRREWQMEYQKYLVGWFSLRR